MRARLESWLNNLNLRTKLWGLYFFCVLVPLTVTDGLFLAELLRQEQVESQKNMEAQANAVRYNLLSFVEYATVIARSVYMNTYVQEFLTTQYDGTANYVANYQKFMRNSLLGGSVGLESTKITMYADNPTIVNGGGIYRLSRARRQPWYETFMGQDADEMALFFYDDTQTPYVRPKRKVLFLRKLNRILSDNMEKLLVIEMEYGNLVRDVRNMNYAFPVYVCRGDQLMFSNEGANNLGIPFSDFTLSGQVGHEEAIALYGEKLRICVLKPERNILSVLKNNLDTLLPLLLLDIALPCVLMLFLGRSITERLHTLSQAFERDNGDTLTQIPQASGRDEIGSLMESYNRMADRMNALIQTVYKDRLREQETNLARQKAELLALHSQINPHFLFNALESIRMHSILKGENETAGMVEKLAIMERQNVDWSNDTNTIAQEMEFVEAYLQLQKYRFGDRLSYRLEMDKACAGVRIPKLTITTFVENACVHGIETKPTPGWIFVRAAMQEGRGLCIEVEDTGDGMEKEALERLRARMRHASIETLQEKGSVGIANACLRIRMMTGGAASFSIESEKGIGTTAQIYIPCGEKEGEKPC